MSTTLPEYNGWTNYMTWAVHLWITNEEGSYDYAREIVAHARRGIDADRPFDLGPDSGLRSACCGCRRD